MIRSHRRTLVAVGALAAGLAFPGQAFGCWDICTARYGGVFGANGTVYELSGCSQTWPDGYHDPVTVCYYTNIYRPTSRM